jgi:hypothetical protein
MSGYIDLDEVDIGPSATGRTRLRLKGGVLQISVKGGAFADVRDGAPNATAAAENQGPTAMNVTAGATLAALRAVTATGQLANATNNTLPPVGVTVAGAANGAPCRLVTHGPAAVLSAATPGTMYWLAAAAGTFTTTKPAVSGNALWLLGIAISATVLQVQLSYLGTVP